MSDISLDVPKSDFELQLKEAAPEFLIRLLEMVTTVDPFILTGMLTNDLDDLLQEIDNRKGFQDEVLQSRFETAIKSIIAILREVPGSNIHKQRLETLIKRMSIYIPTSEYIDIATDRLINVLNIEVTYAQAKSNTFMNKMIFELAGVFEELLDRKLNSNQKAQVLKSREAILKVISELQDESNIESVLLEAENISEILNSEAFKSLKEV